MRPIVRLSVCLLLTTIVLPYATAVAPATEPLSPFDEMAKSAACSPRELGDPVPYRCLAYANATVGGVLRVVAITGDMRELATEQAWAVTSAELVKTATVGHGVGAVEFDVRLELEENQGTAEVDDPTIQGIAYEQVDLISSVTCVPACAQASGPRLGLSFSYMDGCPPDCSNGYSTVRPLGNYSLVARGAAEPGMLLDEGTQVTITIRLYGYAERIGFGVDDAEASFRSTVIASGTVEQVPGVAT